MFRDIIIPKLPPHDERKGWFRFKCPVCNDYKVRAGFNFANDFIVYNCWNCPLKVSHHEEWETMKRDMRRVLSFFGISESDIDTELGKKFFNRKDEPAVTRINQPKLLNLALPEVALPKGAYRLTSGPTDDIWMMVAQEYLASRKLSPDSHPFYLSPDPTYRERLIIPFYKGGKVIYWQARHFDDKAKVRYLNAEVDRDTVVFGFDKLFDSNVKSMFWSEGVFDALSIDCGCLLGSSLSSEKIQLLQRFKKDHIFVVDRDNNGYELGKKVLSLGYKISHVDGTAEDINDSVKRFGKLYTLSSLMKNAMEGMQAGMYLEMYCKQDKPRTTAKGSK